MIPRKRITLSFSVTTILVLASLTSSIHGFSLTSLVAINLLMLTGIHLHLLCPPLVFPGDQSWDLCSFLYSLYLLSDIVRSFNVQHRQYADDTNTNTIRYDTIGEFNVDWKAEYISLSSTGYSADISNLTHSFTHCLSTHGSVLIAWF